MARRVATTNVSPTKSSATKSDAELAGFFSRFYADPLGFVLAAYPWDSDPQLQVCVLPEPWGSKYPACKYGPDKWACQFLEDLGASVRKNAFDGKRAVPPIRMAVSSGHGVGKSCLTAWIVDWILVTRPYAKGTVTAATNAQLESRTWAQIASWTKRLPVAHWFDIGTGRGAMKIVYRDARTEWFVCGQTCRKENSEAFAGQHAASSTSFYIFDEASAIEPIIYDVAEGGLTDGEPMLFVFGNPTRNSGRFFDVFHKDRSRWRTYKVDSREAQITNKEAISEWRVAYGEDSDFFKVRVRGEFPSSAVSQFIDTRMVEAAMRRQPRTTPSPGALAVVGVDFARFGDDSTSICTRIGNDATLPIRRYQKLDGVQTAQRVVEHVQYVKTVLGIRQVVIFGDAGGVGGPIMDMIRRRYYDAQDVMFGQGADNPRLYADKRTEMWARMKDWIKSGGCLPHDDRLKDDLTAPEYFIDEKSRFRLESKKDMKERGLSSPDEADSLAITFAYELNELSDEGEGGEGADFAAMDFDPFKGY